MRLVVVALIAASVAGCTANRPDMPPAIQVAPSVLCAAPGEMTTPEARPEKPHGDYTQRDVALFIEQLHRWGQRGWKRLAAVRAWSMGCVDRAAVRAGGQVR